MAIGEELKYQRVNKKYSQSLLAENTATAKRIGQKLARARKTMGLTQKEMAKKLTIPQSTYANWEQGRREPPLYYIYNIVLILEIDFNYLFGFV
ncbi:helix-turn-helix domain-containing protein [Pumilibacter intestinalis]|uniref:helix-turn-helix domain-containing protein n=1 Tax=Pumilibacter intestinalis TaxID=2941511 RepID=UPI00203F2681|nr:helix-turn-helix transcriptional regulator [Pumilibacter intestinalis]